MMEQIEFLHEDLGWSYRQIASALGVTHTTIVNWANSYDKPREKHLQKLNALVAEYQSYLIKATRKPKYETRRHECLS